jgi:hypothetical protein
MIAIGKRGIKMHDLNLLGLTPERNKIFSDHSDFDFLTIGWQACELATAWTALPATGKQNGTIFKSSAKTGLFPIQLPMTFV